VCSSDLTNATVSCVDNSGATRTDCTISATGGGSGGTALNPTCSYTATNTSCAINVASLQILNANVTSFVVGCSTVIPTGYTSSLGATYVSTITPSFSAAAGSGTCATIADSGGVISVGGQTGAVAGQGNGTSVQMASGSTVSTDLLVYDANGNAVDSSILKANVGTINTAQTITALKTFNPGSFASNFFAPIVNTSTATDSLTFSGSNQYFSMTPGSSFSMSSITAGQKFSIHFLLDVTNGGTASTYTALNPVLCSTQNCSSSPVPLWTLSAATVTTAIANALSATTSVEYYVDCMGTSTAGTIICAPPGRLLSGVANSLNGIIVTGLSGTVYVNLQVNATAVGYNSVGLQAAWMNAY